MRNVIVVFVSALVAFALVAVAGCHGAPVAAPPPPPADPCHDGENLCIRPSTIKNKVDVLFVLDDSPPMGAVLDAWRASLPRLASTVGKLAASGSPVSFHFGVVSADLGVGPTALPALGCRPGGDGAKLHTGAQALAGGVRFIDDNQLAATSNLVSGDLASALDAIADVGTSGCAFPSPLEAAYRALHDPVAENAGFLRSDALLIVVFVTNGDDCSAPPATDLFDGTSAGVAKYGTLDRFRCTQFGIECNGQPVPPMSVSGLTGCSSQTIASGGKLLDVDRYIDFFTKPAAQGGVKVDPSDVILVGVTGPQDPVGVTVTSPCAADANVSSCPELDRSCVSPTDPRFFADPAVRVAAVVAASKTNSRMSACEGSDDALVDFLGDALFERTSSRCLDVPVAARSDGTPDCVATDVTANPDGSTTTTDIPSCAENGHVTPCWLLVDRLAEYDAEGCMPYDLPQPPTCKLPSTCQPVTGADGQRELYSFLVDRGVDASGAPNPAPVGTATHFECATIPMP